MAIKRLVKNIKDESNKNEQKVQSFISKGGRLALDDAEQNQETDHRLTLRIPKSLLDKVDTKRRQRIGTISRNLWILELIEKATQR